MVAAMKAKKTARTTGLRTATSAPAERFHFGTVTDEEISEAVADATRQHLYDRITEEPERFGIEMDADGEFVEEPDVDDFLYGHYRDQTVSQVLISIVRDTYSVSIVDVLSYLPIPRRREGNPSKSDLIAHQDHQIRLMRRLLVMATESWAKRPARDVFHS